MTRILFTVTGLFLALFVTLAIFRIEPIAGAKLIFEGSFGDKFGISRTIVRTLPLLLCGLGITVAWRAGMYNVGGEGQYISGGIAGAIAAKLLVVLLPGVVPFAAIVSATVFGSALACFVAWLQIKRGVQCVISTILLNFIMIQVLGWVVRGPLQESKKELPLSQRLPNQAMFQRFDPQTDLHAGVFVAVLVGLGFFILMKYTKLGYLIRAAGENPRFLRSNNVNPNKVQMISMGISGGLCGMAGGIDYVGLAGQIGDGFSQNWGFMAIPVALLGGLNSLGVMVSAMFFGALMAGGEGLSRFNSSGTTVVYVIQAIAVLGVIGFSRFKPKEGTNER